MFSINGFYTFDMNDGEITYNDVFYSGSFSHDFILKVIYEKTRNSKLLLQPFTIIANNLVHNDDAIRDIVKCTFEDHLTTAEYNNNKALQLAYDFDPGFISVVRVATYDKITQKISKVFILKAYNNLLESLAMWDAYRKTAIKINAKRYSEKFIVKTWVNNYIADANMSPESVGEYIKQDIYGGFTD